jgi:trimeric autotransporter adhesin
VFRSLVESRQRLFKIAVAGGALVLIAGLAGWGGSTLANSAAESAATSAPISVTGASTATEATTSVAAPATSVGPVAPPASAVHASRPPQRRGKTAASTDAATSALSPEATRVPSAPPTYAGPTSTLSPSTTSVRVSTVAADCAGYATRQAELEASRRAESWEYSDQFEAALSSGDKAKAAQILQVTYAAQDRHAEEDAALAREYPGCW